MAADIHTLSRSLPRCFCPPSQPLPPNTRVNIIFWAICWSAWNEEKICFREIVEHTFLSYRKKVEKKLYRDKFVIWNFVWKNVSFLCFARSTSLRSAGRCIKGTTGPWGGWTIASWPSTITWCSYFETSVMVKIRSSNWSDICPFAYEDDGLRSSFLMNLLFPPLITPECNKWQIKLQILYLSMFSFVTE